MGYAELKKAVVECAVKDYRRMLNRCKTLNIHDPDDWLKKHWRKSKSEEDKDDNSLSSIIRLGIDARDFLLDEEALSIYTNIDGKKIIEHVKNTI